MKLYVFQVNNGSTLTFDTDLAVQTVLELKHAIHAKYKIAIQHQVLVVNGGECMAGDRRVCSYSAGTETNPIFLFNKEMILSDRDPTISKTTFSIESEIQVKVEESLLMPAVFHTVASRTQLALEMFEVAKKLSSFCERLVHDEHLQHQGWAAIMANLDDCTLSYQKLLMKFETSYINYQQALEEIKFKLTKLGTAVAVMARIPLLECLTRNSYRESIEKSSSTPEKYSEETEDERSTESVLGTAGAKKHAKLSSSVSASGTGSETTGDQETHEMTDSGGLRAALLDDDHLELTNICAFNVTLLDWINVQDRPNDVESVVRKCFDSINRLDPRIIQPFLADCRDTIAKLDNQNMKAIKGLEDRLYALDQMIASCKKLVNEQKELAQGFLANQKRAENLKDTSVLPDLCLSHTNQLMIMLNNHRKLLDIKKKCTTAKQELANNLQVRLKWCCYVMLHADQDGEKLQALLRLLTELMERVRVVEALSSVPQMYCLAVVEVVRRKMFMRHYKEWAYALVKDGKQLYEAEKFKRETFGKLFRKSFLRNRLFRGLDSWPPSSFCTRKPRRFDDELPDISLDDLQYLKTCCPVEVQPFLMVPIMCDFEPLIQHILTLRHLVQAAQSVDEMSRTITDLLSEQRASFSQSAHRSTPITPQSENFTGTTTPVSSKTPPSLNLQVPNCQPLYVPVPAPLEDLSPDSIDAQTFDFETIGHPNMDPVLQQGSLDLDSLAESPESDFMSAVNEFVIEGNLLSPNPISDPTSPEMMVESLYSSVINAIDNRRMQDTTILERENAEMTALQEAIEKYRSTAQETQCKLRSVKDDLHHLQSQVIKEKHDFSAAVQSMSLEIHRIADTCQTQEQELSTHHQNELLTLREEHEKQIQTLTEENHTNQNIVKDVQRAMLDLEGLMERKEKELTQIETEKQQWIKKEGSYFDKITNLEQITTGQTEEIKTLSEAKDSLSNQVENLHTEIECSQQKISQEFEVKEQSLLKELEEKLEKVHCAKIETLTKDNQEAIKKIEADNRSKLSDANDEHSTLVKEKENQIKDLEARNAELAELRCKLEVELAFKESETEEVKLLLNETKTQHADSVKSQVEAETKVLSKEVEELKGQLQAKNEEHEVGLAELRSLMRAEKDNCISELVDRHEEEMQLLRREISLLQQKALDTDRNHHEQRDKLQQELDQQLVALNEAHQTQLMDFKERKQELTTVISNLQAENDLFAQNIQQNRLMVENEACTVKSPEAFNELEQEKNDMEKRLLDKIRQLETELSEMQSLKSDESLPLYSEECATAEALLSLDSPLHERLQQERDSLQSQIELLEKKKNEEFQNLKTSLIAEQQTNFNTVLTREKLRKEQIINELSDKLKTVTQQQEKDKGLIETLSEDRASLMQEKKQLEEELNRMRSTALVSSAFFVPSTSVQESSETGAVGGAALPFAGACSSVSMGEAERLLSVAVFQDEEQVESAVEASMVTVHDVMISEEKQRILLLERTLHMKEEENKRLSQRLMSQSMSSVSSRHSDKIAIRDFQVGDLVLIILDERHDNYVLFTVGPTLYFLHSESLTALDLKPASGTSRRPWVLGKVMEKEYCQAKKAQNRFKVPLGTKFYRVKAVPWNRKV
ncbi:RB1-inducible coiled-coil protein 1 [Eucyclogobius newberryi]|uniref:RB1-inducible coiled-coil protein 1 n=1 Tax=Eucyclogobius newberryi TaxID=166745 RepID=UPI003B5A35CD